MVHVLVLHPVSPWHLQRIVTASEKHGCLVSIVTIGESKVGERIHGIKEWIRVDELTDDPEPLAALLIESYSAVLPGNEFAVVAADRLAEKLGLYHNNLMFIVRSRQKDLMRAAFKEVGVPQPKVLARLTSLQDIAELNISSHIFPVIIKPINMAMSLYVQLCYSKEDIWDVFEAMQEFKKSKLTNYKFSSEALIEEYVGGDEYSYEAIISDRKLIHGFVTRKFISPMPSHYEIGHLSGISLEEDVKSELDTLASRVATSWGMQWGVMHLEFKLDGNKLCVIEAAARPAGDLIPLLVELRYGCSLEEALLLCRLRLPVSLRQPTKAVDDYYGIRFEFDERKPLEIKHGVELLVDLRGTSVPNAAADAFSGSRRTGHVIVKIDSKAAAFDLLSAT